MLLFVFAVSCENVLGQNPESAVNWSFDGQLVLTTNGQGVFTNFGGPGLKLNFEKCAFSINMMPSLRMEKREGYPMITTALGVGPQFYFLKKRAILSFPAYYNVTSHNWTFSAGFGYVLKKPVK